MSRIRIDEGAEKARILVEEGKSITKKGKREWMVRRTEYGKHNVFAICEKGIYYTSSRECNIPILD